MNTWIKLYLKDITDEDYIHAQKMFKELKLKNLDECYDLYVQSDTLLLADVLKYMNLILLICTWVNMVSLFNKDRSRIRIIHRQ